MSDRMAEVVRGIGQTNIAPVTPYEAVIANTATTYPQDVFVTIPSLDQGRTLKGAVRWSPIPGPNGMIFPTKGDIAQVVRTNEGYYWVTQFIPAVFPAIDPLVDFKATFPAGNNLLNIPVPSVASLVILEYEVVCGSTSDVLVRPNADAGNITNDHHFSQSTLSPLSITPSGTQGVVAGFRLAVGPGGAASNAQSAGYAIIGVRQSTAGRRVAHTIVTTTNTLGVANFYTYTMNIGAVIDSNIGVTTVITNLRIVTSVGNFVNGKIKARYI